MLRIVWKREKMRIISMNYEASSYNAEHALKHNYRIEIYGPLYQNNKAHESHRASAQQNNIA